MRKSLDEIIKDEMKGFGRPVCSREISQLLNKPKRHINKKLKTMQNFGLVVVVKTGKSNKKFWKLK